MHLRHLTLLLALACTNPDADGDGCPDAEDPAPEDASEDRDDDGVGDDCDPCVGDQSLGDLDGDGRCPPLDQDIDGDGCLNTLDPNEAWPFIDADGDGLGDDCDPCFGNEGRGDLDNDGICDDVDTDDDDNGCHDQLEAAATAGLLDLDRNGYPDACEDTDGDGCPDILDPNPEADADTDGDGLADVCDPDDDNDQCPDAVDPDPLSASSGPCPVCTGDDLDGDGLCDDEDDDDDGDGCLDDDDVEPAVLAPDSDRDGYGDHCDDDDDGDGCLDAVDPHPHTFSDDLDGDREGADCDEDIDGDGCLNSEDPAPLDPDPDRDGDGVADPCDPDIVELPLGLMSITTVQRTPTRDVAIGHRFGDPAREWVDAQGQPRIAVIPPLNGHPVHALLPCDLNGDGFDEILFGDSFHELPSGATVLQLSGSPRLDAIACADLDGDGTTEFVGNAINGGHTIWDSAGQWLHGTAWGLWDVGQLDADPALEVVLDSGWVLDGATLELEFQLPGSFRALQLFDVDGDGIDEHLVRTTSEELQLIGSSSILWSRADAPGVFRIGDFDADGHAEIALSSQEEFGWGWRSVLDAASGVTRGPAVYDRACDGWLPYDHDGDGVSELRCEAHSLSQRVFDPVLGQTVFRPGQGTQANLPLVGDLDGDGQMEILWVAYPNAVFEGDRAVLRDVEGSFLDLLPLPKLASFTELMDVDGDGDDDIVAGSSVWDWSPATGFILQSQLLPSPIEARTLGWHDVDGNGYPNLLIAMPATAVTEDLVGIDSATGIQTTYATANRFWVRDVDGDGDAEWIAQQVRDTIIREFDGTDVIPQMAGTAIVGSTGLAVEDNGTIQWFSTAGPLSPTASQAMPAYATDTMWFADGWVWVPSRNTIHGIGPSGQQVDVPVVELGHSATAGDRTWIGGNRYIRGYRHLP